MEEYVKLSLDTYEKLKKAEDIAAAKIADEQRRSRDVIDKMKNESNEWFKLVGEFLKTRVTILASDKDGVLYGEKFNEFLKYKGYSLINLPGGGVGISKDR